MNTTPAVYPRCLKLRGLTIGCRSLNSQIRKATNPTAAEASSARHSPDWEQSRSLKGSGSSRQHRRDGRVARRPDDTG
jgi:hypothetical protein